MENNHLQLTLREMKAQVSSPRFWIGLLGVVVILTVAAPFGTDESFNSVQLFFYWLGIAISTYFTADLVLSLTLAQLKVAGFGQMSSRVLASLAAAIAVALMVFIINTVILGGSNLTWGNAWLLVISCIFITLAISAIFFVAHDSLQEQLVSPAELSTQQVDAPNSPFFERLPESLGTDLISLQAQDHYVEAKTVLGSELILVRLSDAMKELGADHGLQVHRSWWVSRQHITELKRLQNKPHLILSDGTAVPVSRTYSADVKAALAVKAI